MNQIMANIKSRRSKRSFLNKQIPEEIINEIIDAGRYAPSALNKQPWKFIVITNKDCIKRLSSIVKDVHRRINNFPAILKFFIPSLRDPQVVAGVKKTVLSESDAVFHNAPLLIIITSDKSETFACRDCSLASQNMMLYAHSLGISSCFIGRADVLMMSKDARLMIGLPPRQKIQAAIVFGYPPQGEDSSIPERKKDNIINWVR